MSHDRPSIVIEEYLQEIHLLTLTEESVKAATLATRLNTTPSTVHATLSRMQRDGLVNVNRKKQILLTPAGESQAKDLILRHNLAENFLCNTLGIPWYEVHKHAHKLEHAMTPLVVERLAEFLGHPKFCPHGVPIEGYDHSQLKNSFPLDQAEAGMCVTIVMIDETLEDSEELLKHLHEKSIIPGQEHQVQERLMATHTLTLISGDSQATLPFDIAHKIRVYECAHD